ncbi:MAG: flagellar hook-basal body complex protein, partial [Lachnospiraceae bacterium]|nr:flagellar hook-basal body complex protein [Lachnospiraceae bacterium]
MMRSLYSGVSGLKTHQIKMDVIGNNIANVNTVAFKSQSITFSELMYQTTQKASGPNAATGRAGINAKQIGLGVSSAAISTQIATQGSSQNTGNAFDLRISGDAFFVVNGGNGNKFTRDGSFYVDAVGNLAMSSNGYNVMGWQVNKDGDIVQDNVSKLQILSEENMTSEPAATTLATMEGIVDKNDPQVLSKDGKVVNLSFYD